ncbi:hypothetical protein QJS66_12990 [Kocuria rhizophila]|nr:hypothetical protein QJS66_12990 [Kocuria rhizophila]
MSSLCRIFGHFASKLAQCGIDPQLFHVSPDMGSAPPEAVVKHHRRIPACGAASVVRGGSDPA